MTEKTLSKSILPLLSALVATTPLAIDLYLPAFVAISSYFNTDMAQVQLSLSSYLAGYAIGMMLFGPLIDQKGRRLFALFGLLGFGSATDDSATLEWEGSLALLISPTTAIGTEFRTQANRLGGLAEENTAIDAFIAYFPNKSVSITAAYVDLGNLPLQEDSSGFYLTVNANF